MPRLFGKFEIILACTVILLSSVLVFFLPFQFSHKTSNPINQYPWKTYQNNKYKFSFQYPPSFMNQTLSVTEEHLTNSTSYINIQTQDNFFIQISIYPEISDKQQNTGELTTISGIPARFQKTTLGNLETDAIIGEQTISFNYSDRFFSITLYSIEPNQTTVFNQILSTFRFIEQPEISPTCTPRPPCLDATPRCLIPETEDMCPPNATPRPTGKYLCPESGWIDCMPGPDSGKTEKCSPEALNWYAVNCPDYQGVAY